MADAAGFLAPDLTTRMRQGQLGQRVAGVRDQQAPRAAPRRGRPGGAFVLIFLITRRFKR